jgi:hypothetical protein
MMRVLLDKLEEKMKDTAVEGTIGSLFAGERLRERGGDRDRQQRERESVTERMGERERETEKETNTM